MDDLERRELLGTDPLIIHTGSVVHRSLSSYQTDLCGPSFFILEERVPLDRSIASLLDSFPKTPDEPLLSAKGLLFEDWRPLLESSSDFAPCGILSSEGGLLYKKIVPFD